MSENTRRATLELTSASRGSAGVSIFTAQPLERVGRRKPANSICILELSTLHLRPASPANEFRDGRYTSLRSGRGELSAVLWAFNSLISTHSRQDASFEQISSELAGVALKGEVAIKLLPVSLCNVFGLHSADSDVECISRTTSSRTRWTRIRLATHHSRGRRKQEIQPSALQHPPPLRSAKSLPLRRN